MKSFSFSIPGEVIFGEGALSQLGIKLKSEGIDNVLLISDRGLEGVGLVKRIEDILSDASLTFSTFLDVEANPSMETVMKAAEIYKENDAKAIISLGGGASMDVGKVASIMTCNPGVPADYLGFDRFQGPLPPLVAIPTTAGTGSEATPHAMITNKQTNLKFGIVSRRLLPKFTILDPTVIMSLPPKIAAMTGMDALTHAIESYISKESTIFSDAMGEKAMELIGKYLRRFVADRKDIEAASGMMIASTLAGIAFSYGNVGVVHALAHPLGGFYNVAHGMANAILLPIGLEYNRICDKDGRYFRIYHYLKPSGASEREFVPEMLIDEVKKLSGDIGIPQKLRDVGVDDVHIDNMATDAFRSPICLANPRSLTKDDLISLYNKAL